MGDNSQINARQASLTTNSEAVVMFVSFASLQVRAQIERAQALAAKLSDQTTVRRTFGQPLHASACLRHRPRVACLFAVHAC